MPYHKSIADIADLFQEAVSGLSCTVFWQRETQQSLVPVTHSGGKSSRAVCMCVQSWLELASSYVKSIDSNHLVYAGLSGLFGNSTPDL